MSGLQVSLDPAGCGPTASGPADRCATNMGRILLAAGDLVGAYRYFLPMAEAGDRDAIEALVDVCERGADPARAATWRARLEA